ncbi:MAG: signal recognition particle receptor subunit alpha, partial [Asgard group archaeon]|nr:signal recognition particle receptor subunit alpha [Asgard group archaeon]
MFKKIKEGLDTAVEKITQKELTAEKLEKPLYELQLALISNNVAVPIAERIAKEVENELAQTKVGRLASKKKITYEALRKSIINILTSPQKDIDILDLVENNKKKGQTSVLAMFGPNGAGKTTTIAKLTQWL